MAALDYSSDKNSYNNQRAKVQKKSDICKYIAVFINFSLNSLYIGRLVEAIGDKAMRRKAMGYWLSDIGRFAIGRRKAPIGRLVEAIGRSLASYRI